MTRSHAILSGPFVMALLAIAFCVWTALGNDVNICVTAGCNLYQDFSFGGISLWWFGVAAFTVLAACALLGQAGPGCWLAALFLLCDICLLLLMALTAPCLNCLVAAAFFAICYLLFRRADMPAARPGNIQTTRRSALLWLWLALFTVNLGQVAKAQFDVWPILDESGEARERMFFSPSCRHCVEGVNALSGSVGYAFYPVAETDADVYRLAEMLVLLDKGMSLAEALDQSRNTVSPGFFSNLRPDMLLLRFRLLRNKAHVFAAGSVGVPFFEIRGLPKNVPAKVEDPRTAGSLEPESDWRRGKNPPVRTGDEALPVDAGSPGQCGGATPCQQPENPR